jgi:phage shock protein C
MENSDMVEELEQISEPPRLRRSTDDKVVAGVCGGLGRYFGVDPLFFRLAFVVLAIGGGSGVLLYIVGWLIIPQEKSGDSVGQGGSLGDRGPALAGAVLIAVGTMWLVGTVFPWLDDIMLPMVVIAGGAALLWTGGRSGKS